MATNVKYKKAKGNKDEEQNRNTEEEKRFRGHYWDFDSNKMVLKKYTKKVHLEEKGNVVEKTIIVIPKWKESKWVRQRSTKCFDDANVLTRIQALLTWRWQ